MKQRSLDSFLTTRPANQQDSTSVKPHAAGGHALFTQRRPRTGCTWQEEEAADACMPYSPLLHRPHATHCGPPCLVRAFADRTAEDTQLVVRSPVSPPEMISRTAVLDIVLDQREEFAILLQKTGASLHPVSSWMEGQAGAVAANEEQGDDDNEAMLTLHFDVIRERRGHTASRAGGFSSLAFCGHTLFVAAAYARLPFIDVFDLEDVDEAVAEPAHQFDLSRIEGASSVSHSHGTPPCGAALCPLTDQVSVAALSDGATAWLDRRRRRPHTMFPNKTTNLTLGQSARTAPSPLTAIAKVGECMFMTGALSGALKLWDIRKSQTAIAEMHLGAEVGSLSPVPASSMGHHCCGAQATWVNTRNGQLVLLSTGPTGMEAIASVHTEDTSRSATNVNMGAPKAVYCEAMNLLLYPHFAKNALLICNGRVTPNLDSYRETAAAGLESSSDTDSTELPYADDDTAHEVARSAPHFTSALRLYNKAERGTSSHAAPAACFTSAGTASMSLRGTLQFPAEFTVAACTPVERLDTILIGDAYGNIRRCLP